MTIAQAYSLHPQAVEKAIEEEMSNMILKGVFGMVPKGENIPGSLIIPSKFFIKDKGSDGNVELKGRFVGDGHRENEHIYERKSSPTASSSTIFITLADAAEKKKSILVDDVHCAYLNASRGDLPKVYGILGKEMTAVLIMMKPEYAPFVREDETLLVEILKGLYGLIEAGHTWYTHLTRFLCNMGFVICEYDKCVLEMGESNLVIYMNDLLLTGPEDEINKVFDMIEMEFGDCKRKSGPKFKFIGMNFDIKNDGVSVKIDLENILDNVKGDVETPCANNILSITEGVEALTVDNKEKIHSVIAKLLYISKRTRPEILFGVNFLCTRVLEPTIEDAVKLGRVMKYLNGSQDDELFIKINRVARKVVMEVFIDVSYEVHHDSKSHSGMMITMGTGTVLAASTKQKCVSKSSTEAELIAVTDFLGQAIDTKNVSQEIIREEVKLIVYQDNESTINLMKNGIVGDRSKHIKIRFAWIKEAIDNGDFE